MRKLRKFGIFRAAAGILPAAAALALLAAYAAGFTLESAAEWLRLRFQPDETVCESPAAPMIAEPTDFDFNESPDVFPKEQASDPTPVPVMNPVFREKYMPGITNQTDFTIDESFFKRETVKLDDTDEPQILIVHTHSSEAYATDEEINYVNQNDRTLDTNFNVVRVGDELEKCLKDAGIGVLHDRIINDYPSYNGSYSRMLKIVNAYLEEYPTIKMVLDVHRDAIYYRDGTPYAAVTEIDGEKAAQVMFVVGTNAGGLSHDGWRDNMAFAMKLQRRADRDCPGLMRDINLRRERFNQHTTSGSLIVEVGTTGNTLTEALRGVKAFAEVLIAELKD